MKKRIIAFLLAALMIVSLLPITALAKETKYTITLKANGGKFAGGKTEIKEQTNGGGKLKLYSAEQPTRNGYTFDGWYTKATGGKKYEGDSNTQFTFESNTTVYAHWKEKAPEIILLDADGETVLNKIQKQKNDWVDPSTLTYTGDPEDYYHFDYWVNTETGKKVSNWFQIKKDMTFQAKLAINTYTVTFHNDGDYPYTQTFKANEEKKLFANQFKMPLLVRPYYTFEGWATEKGSNTVVYTDQQLVKDLIDVKDVNGGNLDLYAVWKELEVTITYTADDNGCLVDAAGEEKETVAETLPIFTGNPAGATAKGDLGYKFFCWYVETDLLNIPVPLGYPAHIVPEKIFGANVPMDYTAYFVNDYTQTKDFSYTVKYYKDDVEVVGDRNVVGPFQVYVLTENVPFWSALIPADKYTGYHLVSDIPATVENEEVVDAKYEIDRYTIRFETNGGTPIADITGFPYGGVIDFSKIDTELAGYDFEGWYLDAELTEPFCLTDAICLEKDGDVLVLYAEWSQNTFASLIPIITGGELPFEDVFFDNWFYDAVKELYDNGIMNGVAYNKFDPFATLTRGMVVTMLWRVDGQNVFPVSPFEDVARDKWYAEAVDWAYANGIVKGVSETKFEPDAPVTNEQLFTMLARYAQFVGLNVYSGNVLTGFADADAVSDWAYDSVCFAADWNMIYTEDGFIHPTTPATRAQAAYAFAALCE